jgi:hypothetical protein
MYENSMKRPFHWAISKKSGFCLLLKRFVGADESQSPTYKPVDRLINLKYQRYGSIRMSLSCRVNARGK